MADNAPKSLMEAIQYFADPDNALKYLVNLRWPSGVVCPYCDHKTPSFLQKRRIWKCGSCRKQFSVKVGTIFEDSPLPLDKWLTAVWLIAGCKNGVSSYEIARDLKVTQKSAWFMLHRIREAMQDKTATKLGGEVEVDETFIGGKARNMHKSKRARAITGTGGKDKAIALGMVERGGKVRTTVVENRKKQSLQATVRQHVEAGSAIFSDELKSYDGLSLDSITWLSTMRSSMQTAMSTPTRWKTSGVWLSANCTAPISASSRSTCSVIWMNRRFATTRATAATTRGLSMLAVRSLVVALLGSGSPRKKNQHP